MNVILHHKQRLKISRLSKRVRRRKTTRTKRPSRRKSPVRPRQRTGRVYRAEITIKTIIKVCK